MSGDGFGFVNGERKDANYIQSNFKRVAPKSVMVIMGIFPLVILILSATVCFGEEITYDYNHGVGILEIHSQSPAQSLRLTLPMLIPGDIKPGWAAHVNFSSTNVWAEESEYLLDYEMLDTGLTVTYGFDTRLGLALSLNSRNYFGGEMDHFIQGFHDAFGIAQNGRDRVPKDRSVIQLLDPQTGKVTFERSASDFNNNSIDMLLNYNISHGTQTWPSVNAYGVTSYTLKSPGAFKDDNQVDFGFGLGFAKQWSESWYTYAAVGFSIFDDRAIRDPAANVKPLEFYDRQLSGMLALSWHYRPTFAILAQYMCSGPAVKNIHVLNKPSQEVQLGFKWDTRRFGVVEFAFI